MTARGGLPKRAQRARLVDVAHAAQVSRQTVSNALNRPDKLAPETLARVRSEIDRLSFLPNLAARSLRQRKANALGIEMNATGHGRLGGILDSFLVELTMTAREHDAHVIAFAAENYLSPLAEYERLLSTQMVSGFVLTNTRHEDPRPGWLRDQHVPFVSFGRVWDDPSFTAWADVDGKAGIVHGVHHLVRAGYSPIGYLGWPQGSPVGDDRHSGWVAATTELGMYDPTLQAISTQDMTVGAQAAASLIERVGTGGAIACVSDTLALAAYGVLRDNGLRPGVDFGLIGFDDNDFAQAFGLTSLRQPLADIARTLLLALAGAESGAVAPTQGVVFDPLVIRRRSTNRSITDRLPSDYELAITNKAGNRTDDGGST
jgi:DNA-binding LacI/PurR family transcriptional regulator